MPKVSIDGEPHGDLLLMAIGSGVTAAVVILMILISLIRYKNESQNNSNDDKKVRQHGDFVMTPASSEYDTSTTSTQKSTLMFRCFGKSLSSFEDPEKREVPQNLDIESDHQLYKQNIFIIADVNYHSEMMMNKKPTKN